jgi:AraC-like DNA-binding protein
MMQQQSAILESGVPCQWLIAGIRERELDPALLLSELGIDTAVMDSPNVSMELSDYMRLFNAAAKTLKDENLGLHLSIDAKVEHFGLLAYLSQNAKTIGDALRIFEHYYRVFTPEFGIQFIVDESSCTYHYHHKAPENIDPRQDIEFSLAIVVDSILKSVTGSWKPELASFTFSEPSDLEYHYKIFGENLHFDQAKNFIRFDKSVLELERTSADSALLMILQEHGNALLRSVKDQDNVEDQIRVLITSNAGHQNVNTESIAKHLNMSVRNLHRVLRERGTSYQQIRDETLLNIGKEALSETRSSVTEIALRLGYSESSAFVRMFKRHTGMTPLQFRKNLAT